jgi:hypothetical protein
VPTNGAPRADEAKPPWRLNGRRRQSCGRPQFSAHCRSRACAHGRPRDRSVIGRSDRRVTARSATHGTSPTRPRPESRAFPDVRIRTSRRVRQLLCGTRGPRKCGAVIDGIVRISTAFIP